MAKAPKQKIDRVPRQKVVQGASAIVTPKSPDYMFVKDNPFIIKKEGGGIDTSKFLSGAFSFGSSGSSGNSIFPSAVIPTEINATNPDAIFIPDVPSLADIESIEYQEYADPTTGVAKYRAIIKIRNSSKEKENVDGVDARVYDTSGVTAYSFTATATASGTDTKSNYISNTTWYKATATYDPFEGTLINSESIVSNAQYPSDGVGVPADSTTGISTQLKQAIAWRKTEAEALAAVKALYAKYVI